MTLVSRRHEQGKHEHRRVQQYLGFVGDRPWRHEREQRRETDVGERGAQRSSSERENQAFREQLPDETAPACAERDAHRHFALPDSGPRQQQVRDVGARDQQQQGDGAEEHPDVARDRARERLLEGQQADAPLLGELRGLALPQVSDDRPEIGLRLRVADAGLQTSEQVHVPHALDDLAPLQRDRQIDVRAPPHESLRHHADHRAGRVVEPELAAEDAGIPVELPLPESIAEDDDRLGAGSRVVGGRGAPDERRHAHDVEGVERAVVPPQPLRLAVPDPQHVADRRRDHALEDSVPLRDLQELIHRIPGPAPSHRRIADADAHQVVDVLVGERIEDDRVKHAVDRGGRHDPQREREYGQDTESWRSDQSTDAKLDITPEFPEPVHHGRYHAKASRKTLRLLGTAVAGSSLPSISSETHPLKFALRSVCAMRR